MYQQSDITDTNDVSEFVNCDETSEPMFCELNNCTQGETNFFPALNITCDQNPM